ncbi:MULTISPECIES: hypothetical protein [Lysinibacillus]|uniref:hypothetical protein n=1 Tax=Lysinibacillus TaxID=400634 RepID=UPI00214B157C|nr:MULTISPECIES: hypothetical protein [Lysinibacillus]UUV25836.1 hypothetical protein NP781_04265 [Lysinibacillus sp. FN11]UYB48710.1 hypothetical protein OCI51_07060 [Lysinibacillus capsici]
MDELVLNELKKVKELLQVVMSSQEQNENRIIQMLSIIEGRLYSIEENTICIKNGGRFLGDAKGHAGVPGL